MPEQELPNPIKIKIAQLLGYSFTFSVLNCINKKWYTTLQEYRHGSSVISVYICQKTRYMVAEETLYYREQFFESAARGLNRERFFISDNLEEANWIALQNGLGCHVLEIILPIRYLKINKDKTVDLVGDCHGLELDEDYEIKCDQIKAIYLNGQLARNRSINNPKFNITIIDQMTKSLNKGLLQPKTNPNKSKMVIKQINQNQTNKCLVL